ncbi:DNA replication/repair protein RecF [Lentisphaerota bacterium ZTH]|nr:DNA replication/repair protein RecF [Lentisphaerota bacterium]WET06382.1 DNA replication/repair protein RecF [Lentisphaerota bacterium ZTH]
MIKRLQLNNFRNYKSCEVSLHNRKIVFTGRNGQGKTNLLEALFFLSLLRSFRTSRTNELRRIGSGGFHIGAEISRKNYSEILEVDYSEPGRRKLTVDKNRVSKASEFINQLRAVAFTPEDINIVTGNSGMRRRFMDMLISVLQPEYLAALHSYNAAVKSRNAVLKSPDADLGVVKAYEPIMAQNAVKIVELRQKYCCELESEVNALLSEFSRDKYAFTMRYRGDLNTVSVEEAYLRFERERSRDIRRGFTGFGPQLDEFEMQLQGRIMRSFASTGQCRLISLCLKLAKVNILCRCCSDDINNIIVLVDDVTGELDAITRHLFFQVINQAGQAFFTFTEKPLDSYFETAEFYEINNGSIV